MCDLYRKVRDDRPDIARLLWRRVTNAKNIIINAINEKVYGVSNG